MVNLSVDSKVIKGVELVIFDKDGTLIDLYTYWSNMVNYRVDFIKNKLSLNQEQKEKIAYRMGIDFKNRCLRKEGPVGIKKRQVVMEAMEKSLDDLGFKENHKLCFEAFKEADEISSEHLSEIIRPVAGMQGLIDSLKERSCRIAVATTDKTRRAELAVKTLGISDEVDVSVGEDLVNNYKPHPEMVNLILKKLSVKPSNAVMVGDAVSDIEMGNNAGLLASIAVSSGIASRDQFLGKTGYIIKDISEIKVV